MSRLECIQYLIDNGVGGSEWQEAGMWNAVQEVMRRDDVFFEPPAEVTQVWMDDLIERARNN
jgi:hypothetical protein